MNTATKPAIQGTSRLTFGMVPTLDDQRTRLRLSDFCALLSERLEVTILPHRAPSPVSLMSAMQAGRVHIAWLSPTLYVTTGGLSSVLPLVSSVREGMTVYHTALFVPERSPVRRPEDLSGARAAWVAPTSASGYLFSRLSLARRGINLQAMFATETFYDTHGQVAAAVLEGRADVGATFAVYEGGSPARTLVRAGFLKVVPGRTGRVIDVAGPIPADMIVAVPAVEILVRSAMAVALLRISEDPATKELLRSLFGVESFCAFASSSLRPLIELRSELELLSAEAQVASPRRAPSTLPPQRGRQAPTASGRS